jgi:cell division protein FtsB
LKLQNVPGTLFRRIARRKTPLLIAATVIVYLWVALKGPQGIQTLIDKHREIRELQEQNANMARDNEMLKERIRRLEQSKSEQEMEIRKQLKLQRPGETTFILPDGKSGDPK